MYFTYWTCATKLRFRAGAAEAYFASRLVLQVAIFELELRKRTSRLDLCYKVAIFELECTSRSKLVLQVAMFAFLPAHLDGCEREFLKEKHWLTTPLPADWVCLRIGDAQTGWFSFWHPF